MQLPAFKHLVMTCVVCAGCSPKTTQSCRTYALDDSARLLPDRPEAIQQKKRYLRPPGVGSMTALAAVRGKGAQLELVSVGGGVVEGVGGVLTLGWRMWWKQCTKSAIVVHPLNAHCTISHTAPHSCIQCVHCTHVRTFTCTHSCRVVVHCRCYNTSAQQWTFKLKRDEHSDFTFCFQDREQALRWYDTLAQVRRLVSDG